MNKLTLERLKELFEYDPLTGVFTRNGKIAGSTSGPYTIIWIDRHWYKAHDLAWFYTHGIWPDFLIDHKNGDGHFNAPTNLRKADYSTNGANRKLNKNNSIGFKGVRKYRDGFLAVLIVNGKTFYGTKRMKAKEAALDYDKLAVSHFGEFAKTNQMMGLLHD